MLRGETLPQATRRYTRTLERAYEECGEVGLDEVRALLGRTDLYFLVRYLLSPGKRLQHPWLFARCREVQADPNGYLDLWFREAGKSTIITFGLTIQDMLNDPERTFCIFSHTRPIAKGFLRWIKQELESNAELKRLYPDVLWAEPRKEAPKWSEDDGLVVKRKGNPKESTLEAWGLVDGAPTSKHFQTRIYDDVVTKESVSTAEQIEKTTEAWENSDNLGVAGGVVRTIGTRWHLYDSYRSMMDRGAVKPRVYPATHNGLLDGLPVLFAQEVWDEKKKRQSGRVIAAQHLMNPIADGNSTFRLEWLRAYEVRPRTLNVYIMGDPSKGRNASNDRTAIAAIGISAQGGKYLLDGYCHRMPQSRRWECLRGLYKKWSAEPGVLHIEAGWERYGMQTDDEYFEERMKAEKLTIPIRELSWVREGGQSKPARVERLEPDFRNGRFYLPGAVMRASVPSVWDVASICPSCRHETLIGATIPSVCEECGTKLAQNYMVQYRETAGLTRSQRDAMEGGSAELVARAIIRKDEEGKTYDLTERFIGEFEPFPFGQTDDLIDAVSRIYDMDPMAPFVYRREDTEPAVYPDS